MDAFLKWFYEGVMRFDSMEYRRRFWHEAYRNGHTIGHTPRTAIEFTDSRRHSYNEWLANLAVLMVAMGASAVVWYLVRTLDAHIRRLRLPDRPGALAATLDVFVDRALNLSSICSQPVPERPWEYAFFLDVEAPALAPAALSAVFQLSRELPFLRVLGWYGA